MAKVISVRSIQALKNLAELARDFDDVLIGTQELRSLLHRAEKFETMWVTLRAGGWKGRPDLELPRLIGTCQTLERLLESSISDMTWPVWAHLRLGLGGEPLATGHVLRGALGDKLDELNTWITWATELYRDYTEAVAPAPETARHWIEGMARRGHLAEVEETMAGLAPASPRASGEESDGWFGWAAQALGLSDAYVAEQKLTTGDLRRMIKERL